MTSEVNIETRIEADERWLRAALRESRNPNIEEIKTRVRIAVQERWFASRTPTDAPADLAARVKLHVRSEIDSRQPARTPALRRTFRLGITIAISAAGCVVAVLSLHPMEAVPELADASAFEQFEDDDSDLAMVLLDNDIRALEPIAGEFAAAATDDSSAYDESNPGDDGSSDPMDDNDWS